MKKILKKVKSRRGSEIVQVLLVAAIFLVLTCTVFYNSITGLLSGITGKITEWFNTNGSKIFTSVSAPASVN